MGDVDKSETGLGAGATADLGDYSGIGELAERMGIELVELAPERVVGTMPVEGNTQPVGLLHGGASMVLAETLGSVGSALHCTPGQLPVGIEIGGSHHRSASEGTVRGTATPLHVGRTLVTWHVTIEDARARLVCTARITCLLR